MSKCYSIIIKGRVATFTTLLLYCYLSDGYGDNLSISRASVVNKVLQDTTFLTPVSIVKQNVQLQPSTLQAKNASDFPTKQQRMSFNFQEISVRAALQFIAEFSATNIVVSDAVTGNITLYLKDTTAEEALDMILKTKNLTQQKVSNALLITPFEKLSAKKIERQATLAQVYEARPLVTDLIPLSYAKASEMVLLIKNQSGTILSTRGYVKSDERTNSILIQDIKEKVYEVQQLIQKLDVPVKQVLIEARVVNLDTNFEESLGIRWGSSPSSALTSLEGTFINTDESATQLNTPGVNLSNRLNVNLPAMPTTGFPGSLGLAVAKLGQGYLLDLEISALESEGALELISSPRLLTANKEEAYIEKGEEIPYQEQTASGATSVEFKKAVLGLRVRPHITVDGKINLHLKINQDRRSAQPEVLGVPAIDTQQIETNVLVDNGETIVLGGIYEERSHDDIVRIPLLGTLPVVGALFKSSKEISIQRELLIFITPQIIQQALVK